MAPVIADRAPLGKLTSKPSGLWPQRLSLADFLAQQRAKRLEARRVERRRGRRGLRGALRGVTTVDRVKWCGRLRISTAIEPQIRVQDGVAHWTGLQLCGSVWLCPVCSPRIRQQRALDADRACTWWLERYGQGSVMLLTLTLPHERGERLAKLLDLVRKAFGLLVAGAGWQADKAAFGLQHYIRAHDSTVGEEHGWHPHLHVILLADRVLSPDERHQLESRLFERWSRAVVHRGHRLPSREHGIQLQQARTRGDVARYVCQVVAYSEDGEDERRPKQVALELARSDLKQARHAGHRTPFEVLEDFAATGDCADLALWHEWETATKGVHAIRWSKGLRALVGLDQEQSDEEIVAEQIGGEPVYQCRRSEWVAIRETPEAEVELLELAEANPSAVAPRVAELVAVWQARRRSRLLREEKVYES